MIKRSLQNIHCLKEENLYYITYITEDFITRLRKIYRLFSYKRLRNATSCIYIKIKGKYLMQCF